MAKIKQPKLTKEQKETQAIYDQFTGDLGQAQTLYNSGVIPNARLDRLDPSRSHETNILGATKWAYANPELDTFAGRMSSDAKEMLGWRKSMLNPTSANYAGRRSTDQSALLDRYKQKSFNAGVRSADMNDIVSRYKAGLGGYTAAENQGFREQAERGFDTQYRTDLARTNAANARSGVRGASAAARTDALSRQRRADQQDFEQSLFVKNADEIQNRLKTYSDFMSGLENTEYNRGREGMSDYRDILSSLEGTEYGRVQDALKGYEDLQTGLEKEYFTRGQGALKEYTDYLKGLQDTERAIATFNVGQGEKEQARDAAAVLSLMQMLNTERNQRKQNDIMARERPYPV